MPAHRPEDVPLLFAEAFNAGDLAAAIALYEPQATLVVQPGQIVTGREAIQEALQGFLALRGHLDSVVNKVLQADDLALVCNRWQLTGTGPDGAPLTLSGQTTDVARRQADGTWLLAVDNPYGVADLLGAPGA